MMTVDGQWRRGHFSKVNDSLYLLYWVCLRNTLRHVAFVCNSLVLPPMFDPFEPADDILMNLVSKAKSGGCLLYSQSEWQTGVGEGVTSPGT